MSRSSREARRKHHNMTGTRVHEAWCAMKRRCSATSGRDFYNYRLRGITVCKEWADSFAAFLSDMGHPDAGMTLDRIDNNGQYCKSNCRWASPQTQQNNKTNNILLEIDGVIKTASDWTRESTVNRNTIFTRLKRGWDAKRAVFQVARSYENVI